MSFKPVPPRDGVLLVPTGNRRDAAAALGMYPACKWRAALALRGAFIGVTALGSRVIPGRAIDWEPPLSSEGWLAVLEEAQLAVGRVTAFGVHLRRPLGRDGVTLLLLRSGVAVGFVKVRRSPSPAIETEQRVLEILARDRPVTFRAPGALAHGDIEGWRYLVLSSLTTRLHRVPGRVAFEDLQEEIGDKLSEGLRRPESTPDDWRPMHGDFTPWNLRRTRDGLALLDWEEASWGPPGADLAWYDLNVEASKLSTSTTGVRHSPELYRFWLDKVAAKSAKDTPTDEVMRSLRRLAG